MHNIKTYLLLLLVYFCSHILADGNGKVCVTPNGENATCIPIDSCKVIRQAIAYLEESALEFARKSQCGYQNGPLVCCGSLGRPITTPIPIEHNPEMTKKPPPVINNIYLPDHSLCGIQTRGDRIVGGEITNVNEFPWMAALKYVDNKNQSAVSFRCSGTLINQRYVLTAAQCLYIPGYTLKEVRLGEWRFSTVKDCSDDEDEETCADPVLDVKIEEKTSHPYYSRNSGNNDIALLTLATKIKYTEFIRPICLPPPDLPQPLPGTSMLISGWGETEKGTTSDVKLKVKITMRSNADCIITYPDYVHINPNQACAGGDGGKDACFGDSGGPLMSTHPKNDETQDEQWYQEGIIYRGLGCGIKGVPGLYTRTSRYITWIINSLKHP